MKEGETDRRAELRRLMQQDVENNLISAEEVERLSGVKSGATSSATSEETCKCWCSTGLVSTCKAGTVDESRQ